MQDRIRALASKRAGLGTTGYWEYPEPESMPWAFEAGLPDPASFPIDDLARIAERVLRTDADDGLQYGGGAHGSIVYGYEGLRDQLAVRTQREDAREVGRREVILTSGGVQGLSMACDAFLDPGDVVAVEAPTWGAVLTAARMTGAEPCAIPVDADGLQVDKLEAELDRIAAEGKRLKLVYSIATFHTPTGVCLSLERRRRLLALARERDFMVLEDNVYGDLRYDGEALPTIFSLDTGDEAGRVIRVDSFSKTLAPALRIGWVTGHADAIAALSAVRGDLGVSQWLARMLAIYLEEGLLEPHIERVNALYRQKRDVAAAALREHCGEWVHFEVPAGGYFLWCELSDKVNGKQLLRNGLSEGVVCRPGERFFGDPDDGRSFFRLAFSMVPVEEIERGIAALGRAMQSSLR
jgi:2-aminoadipate transaminase